MGNGQSRVMGSTEDASGDAVQKLDEAIRALSLTRFGYGNGPGAREAALAATNAEQAEMWLKKAQERRAEHLKAQDESGA